MLSYVVKLARRYDGLFIATFPDVPDVVAYGRDDEEALEEAGKSLRAAIGRRLRRGLAIPPAASLGGLKIGVDGRLKSALIGPSSF